MSKVSFYEDIEDARAESTKGSALIPAKKAKAVKKEVQTDEIGIQSLTPDVAEEILMEFALSRGAYIREKWDWLTVEQWSEYVRDYYYEQNGGNPPTADLVKIVARALSSLYHKGHARQYVWNNSAGKWKVFHYKLQLSTEEKRLKRILQELPDASVLIPPKSIYDTPEWKEFSPSFREYKGWQCEECGLSLHEKPHQRYIDTHHKFGLQRQDSLEDFQALCRGCHAEKPGYNHKKMKGEKDYKDFMALYKKEWHKRRSKRGLPS